MDARTVLLIIHLFGVAMGVGGAIVSDVIFLRTILDRRITSDEYGYIRLLSRVVWAGLILLLISGPGFLVNQYLQLDAIPLLHSPRFLTKLTMVLLVFLNGLIFHFKVFPIFKRAIDKDLRRLKKSKLWLIAISGAVSSVSWYGIVIVSVLPRSVDIAYPIYLTIYSSSLFLASISARLLIGWLIKRQV